LYQADEEGGISYKDELGIEEEEGKWKDYKKIR
jgi:hypothetical protein